MEFILRVYYRINEEIVIIIAIDSEKMGPFMNTKKVIKNTGSKRSKFVTQHWLDERSEDPGNQTKQKNKRGSTCIIRYMNYGC